MEELLKKYADLKDQLAEVESQIRAERVKLEAQISDVNDLIGAPKRGRGRRKKAAPAETPGVAPVKRGPGRPRKVKAE